MQEDKRHYVLEKLDAKRSRFEQVTGKYPGEENRLIIRMRKKSIKNNQADHGILNNLEKCQAIFEKAEDLLCDAPLTSRLNGICDFLIIYGNAGFGYEIFLIIKDEKDVRLIWHDINRGSYIEELKTPEDMATKFNSNFIDLAHKTICSELIWDQISGNIS